MNENLKKNDVRNGSNGKLEMGHVNVKTGIVRRVVSSAAGFICLAITATMLLSGCGGNIEDFIVDYAGVARAERRACAIKHFGSPDQEMQGSLLVYKDRGVVVDTGSREFLLLIGTDLKAVTVPGMKGFTGTIVHDIRITEAFDKLAEVLKKNQEDGKISKLKMYGGSAFFMFEKNGKRFKIIIRSSNNKVLFAQVKSKN